MGFSSLVMILVISMVVYTGGIIVGWWIFDPRFKPKPKTVTAPIKCMECDSTLVSLTVELSDLSSIELVKAQWASAPHDIEFTANLLKED